MTDGKTQKNFWFGGSEKGLRSTQPVADGRGLESSGGQLLAENLGYPPPMRTNYLNIIHVFWSRASSIPRLRFLKPMAEEFERISGCLGSSLFLAFSSPFSIQQNIEVDNRRTTQATEDSSRDQFVILKSHMPSSVGSESYKQKVGN